MSVLFGSGRASLGSLAMRVAYLTAGAGGMYCGSCLRDNTLASALIRMGRDIVLIPVFSPIRTDEPDVSQKCIYYGGINIYLQQQSALFRHTPRLLDRLLDHPALLRLATKKAGSASQKTSAQLTLSILKGEGGAQRKELARLIRGLADLKPDLVHLPNVLFVGLARRIKEQLGVPVICTLTGEDIFIEKLPQPQQSDILSLIHRRSADVDGFLSVSQYYTAYATKHFGIREDRIHQVPLGIHLDDAAASKSPVEQDSNPSDRPLTIGYLARICPEKGLHLLCEAFSQLHAAGRVCRLKVAGFLGDSDRDYFRGIQARMAEQQLDRFIDYLGEVDRAGKFTMLRSLDIFSVPTVYHEAKGLYVLEALSQGVPVVQPGHGSFPELIEATGGGVLFEPGNVQALVHSIEGLMDDQTRRQTLGRKGRMAVAESFNDHVMAETVWHVFESCVKAYKDANRHGASNSNGPIFR